MTQQPKESQFPCPSCGGSSAFDPQDQALKCGHCGSVTAIPNAPWSQLAAQKELCFDTARQITTTPANDHTTYATECSGCGAQLQFDDDTGAKQCPYCASAIVRPPREIPALTPKGVIPFALTQGQARHVIEKWLSSRWFLPSKLRSFAKREDGFQGVYAPFWTFDAQTETTYVGRRGDHYYVTRQTKNGIQRERRTRWSSARGRVTQAFDDLVCIGSAHLPQELLIALDRWDLRRLHLYNPAYIAGFTSELYSVPIQDGFEQAKAKMDPVLRQRVRQDIGGDVQQITGLQSQYSDVTYKHILLPLWVAAYRYNGKVYDVIINGQSGEIVGDRPYSIVKIALTALAVAVVIGGVAAIGYANDWFQTP